MITKSELEELEKIASRANKISPGPWEYKNEDELTAVCCKGDWVATGDSSISPAHDSVNMQFIATANPEAILKLIDSIRELELIVKGAFFEGGTSTVRLLNSTSDKEKEAIAKNPESLFKVSQSYRLIKTIIRDK